MGNRELWGGETLADKKRRNLRIWQERGAGASISDLAEKYELTERRINEILNRVADDYMLEEAGTIIKLELDRLDILLTKALEVLNARHLAYSHGKLLWDESSEGNEYVTDSKPVLDAINSVLKIMDRRSRYLGLDAPTKSEQTVNVFKRESQDLELQRMIKQATAQVLTLRPEDVTLLDTEPLALPVEPSEDIPSADDLLNEAAANREHS